MRLILLVILLAKFLIVPAKAKTKTIGIFISEFGKVVLTSVDIKETSVTKFESDFTLNVRLQENAAKKLGKLTKVGIGKSIGFSVCGEEIAKPIVHVPIFSGILSFPGLQSSKAMKVSAVLDGKKNCTN